MIEELDSDEEGDEKCDECSDEEEETQLPEIWQAASFPFVKLRIDYVSAIIN